MRIKKISGEKIVVHLTESDLAYFDLDFEKKIPQTADLHKFLYEVMELVKKETGFDPYNGGQVVVEASPSENGVSLVISKIADKKRKITRSEFARASGVRVKKKSNTSYNDFKGIADRYMSIDKTVFIFDCFDDLEGAVLVSDSNAFSELSLYKCGTKYALVSQKSIDKTFFNLLSEYAVDIVVNEVTAADITEGWQLIAENESLFDMAKEIHNMNN